MQAPRGTPPVIGRRHHGRGQVRGGGGTTATRYAA